MAGYLIVQGFNWLIIPDHVANVILSIVCRMHLAITGVVELFDHDVDLDILIGIR